MFNILSLKYIFVKLFLLLQRQIYKEKKMERKMFHLLAPTAGTKLVQSENLVTRLSYQAQVNVLKTDLLIYFKGRN